MVMYWKQTNRAELWRKVWIPLDWLPEK